ncbi:MAG: hypothetical protein JW807_09965 [Spirochaetes bacterium]|nr:hypothetical protein [Spirochaetota bacterium]
MRKSFLALLLGISICRAAPSPAAEYGADELLRFTRYLADRKEYYRALVELKRIRSYYPLALGPLAYNVSRDYFLFEGMRYAEVAGAGAGDADPLMRSAGLLFRCDAVAALSEFDRLDALTSVWKPGADPFLDRILMKRRLFSLLMARRYEDASELCGGAYGCAEYRETIEFARSSFSSEKKPYAAALLGILPGMGYVYSGETATGIFALILISVDVLVTCFAFRSRNDIIGYFTGIVGGMFYAGSIAGGYFASKRFNTKLEGRVREALSGEMRFGADRKEVYERYGIGRHGR